jgi:hypothetical protein
MPSENLRRCHPIDTDLGSQPIGDGIGPEPMSVPSVFGDRATGVSIARRPFPSVALDMDDGCAGRNFDFKTQPRYSQFEPLFGLHLSASLEMSEKGPACPLAVLTAAQMGGFLTAPR